MSFDIDYEIVYTVKSGYNQFNKIWSKVKGIGSKQTFSKHLAQLVKDETISKKIVKGKPEYVVSDDEHYKTPIMMKERINDEINHMENSKKKVSDKVVLKLFVERAKMEIVILATENLKLLMPLYESDKGIAKNNIKMLSKILKYRIDYLQKRDPELVILFDNLIKKSLDEVNFTKGEISKWGKTKK
ncbi:MAG: hypothetical protein HRU07_07255 [Nitrosopumilus sp.]|nr:hypothetical protein [Nitrosopumilus sp.]NRA05935.1 hypothetical protein [Nitrosopumilus sp.]